MMHSNAPTRPGHRRESAAHIDVNVRRLFTVADAAANASGDADADVAMPSLAETNSRITGCIHKIGCQIGHSHRESRQHEERQNDGDVAILQRREQ